METHERKIQELKNTIDRSASDLENNRSAVRKCDEKIQESNKMLYSVVIQLAGNRLALDTYEKKIQKLRGALDKSASNSKSIVEI